MATYSQCFNHNSKTLIILFTKKLLILKLYLGPSQFPFNSLASRGRKKKTKNLIVVSSYFFNLLKIFYIITYQAKIRTKYSLFSRRGSLLYQPRPHQISCRLLKYESVRIYRYFFPLFFYHCIPIQLYSNPVILISFGFFSGLSSLQLLQRISNNISGKRIPSICQESIEIRIPHTFTYILINYQNCSSYVFRLFFRKPFAQYWFLGPYFSFLSIVLPGFFFPSGFFCSILFLLSICLFGK